MGDAFYRLSMELLAKIKPLRQVSLCSDSGWRATNEPIEQRQQHRAQDRHNKSSGLACHIHAQNSS